LRWRISLARYDIYAAALLAAETIDGGTDTRTESICGAISRRKRERL